MRIDESQDEEQDFQLTEEERMNAVFYDSKGRITNVGASVDLHSGHSVCVHCGKYMPKCWDVLCANCGDASCYEHAHEVDGYWACYKCHDVAQSQKDLIDARICRHSSFGGRSIEL